MKKTLDRLAEIAAWALPRRLVYWCGVRLSAHASTSQEFCAAQPDEISVLDALRVWDS